MKNHLNTSAFIFVVALNLKSAFARCFPTFPFNSSTRFWLVHSCLLALMDDSTDRGGQLTSELSTVILCDPDFVGFKHNNFNLTTYLPLPFFCLYPKLNLISKE